MTSISNESGIFIHSLWRSASTYLFNAFRRSDAGYWAYQEPLHEIILVAKANPEILSAYTSEALAPLRHPQLQKPYFYELQETHQAWCEMVKKSIIYDDYFGAGPIEPLANYLRTLLSSAKGRPVIQECRTSGRIGAIKRSLGGSHIYLWRNPWDQWWSFKLSDYFDAAYQIILGAYSSPAIIVRLREEIGYSEFHHDNVDEEFKHFMQFRLSSENSYLVFYTLWCLGLLEGMAYADQMVNIDTLSTSSSYQIKIASDFDALGMVGVDFSDCHAPQGFFDNNDKAFFTNIENRVHGLLLVSGYSQETVNTICHLRDEHVPPMHSDTNTLVRDLQRARQTALRLETTEASRGRHFHQLIDDLDAQAKVLERDLNASKLQLETIGGQLELSERQAREAADTLALTKRELSDHLQSSQNYLQTSQLSLFELTKSHAEREHVLNQQVQIVQQELRQIEQERSQLENELAEQNRQALQEQASFKRTLAEREQAVEAQLQAMKLQASQEIAEQAKIHKEQSQLLHRQQAEQEQLLTQQLIVAQEALFKAQQDLVKHEEVLSEQTSQTRHEVEVLLITLAQREQQVAAELEAMQQQADFDKAQLAKSHNEQTQKLHLEHAGSKQALKQQLEAGQEELLNTRKEHLKREQVLSEQTIQTRMELEALMRTLAQREQEVALQLLALKQEAEQEKTELVRIYAEQAKEMHSQHAKREKALNQQLHTKQQEIRNLHKDRIKYQREAMAQLLAIQQQANQEKIDQTRSHAGQIHSLEREFAEREQALGQKLQAAQLQQQRLELSLQRQEQEFTEDIQKSRLDQENLRIRLEEREQEIAKQLVALHQQAEQEKSELERIHIQQNQALQGQHAKREQALNQQLTDRLDQLRQVGQERMQLEQQLAEQIIQTDVHNEQAQALKRQHAELEQALRQQLQNGHAELERVEHERLRLEQRLAEQAIQNQQARESFQIMLAQQEQNVAAQILEIKQKTDQEKAELTGNFNEKEQALQRKYSEQEALLVQQLQAKQVELDRIGESLTSQEMVLGNQIAALENEAQSLQRTQQAKLQEHEAELSARMDEHNRLLSACEALESQLKADILSERQASLQLQRLLSQTQHSLAFAHASIAWRIMSPIYALGAAIDPKKFAWMTIGADQRSEIMFASLEPNSININHSSIGPDMTHTVQSTKINPPPIAKTLDELLAYHDQQFIYCAFRTILGRDPDPEGMGYYLGRLRTGYSKMRLIAQLRISEEGSSHNSKLRKLDEAIERYMRGQIPVVGALFRWFYSTESNHPIERKLRGIENQLFLFNEDSERRFNQLEKAITSLHEVVLGQAHSISSMSNALSAAISIQQAVIPQELPFAGSAPSSSESVESSVGEADNAPIMNIEPISAEAASPNLQESLTNIDAEVSSPNENLFSFQFVEPSGYEQLSPYARKIYSQLKAVAFYAKRVS